MKKRLLFIPLALLAGGVLWLILHPKPFRYAGTIEATEVDVAARLAAPLLEIYVKEGDTLRQGDRLFTLDGADLKLTRDQAERDYQRGLQLHRSGTLPEEALEKLRLKRDESALRFSWCESRSPLDGTVLRRDREPGEWVTPGQRILTLANLKELTAFIYVPAPVMERLHLGQEVPVTMPFINKEWKGRVVLIRSEAEFTPKNVQTRTERERLVYGIKIALDGSDGTLKPGQSVEVTLPEAS